MKIYVGVPVLQGVIEDIIVSVRKKEVEADRQAFNKYTFGINEPDEDYLACKSGEGTEYIIFTKELDLET